MNAHAPGTRVLAGVASHRPARLGLLVPDEPNLESGSTRLIGRSRDRGDAKTRRLTEAGSEGRFVQPVRFNRLRYRRVFRALRGRLLAFGLLVTAMVLMMLAWRTVEGHIVSERRWVLGACSGMFIVVMLRLALFVCLSAPQFIGFKKDRIELSGLGILRPEEILKWSLARGVIRGKARQCPFAHLEIHYRWMGQEGRWSMYLEEGAAPDQLQGMLKAVCAFPRMSEARDREKAMAQGAFVPLRT